MLCRSLFVYFGFRLVRGVVVECIIFSVLLSVVGTIWRFFSPTSVLKGG
jgi:hypothetical protein